MALVTLPSVMVWPEFIKTNNVPSVASLTALDAAGEYECFISVAREAMAISHVWFRCSVSGSPTADVRIETVDVATGLPSGTLWAANTNAISATLTAGGNLTALTATANIAVGQAYAVKVVYASGTSLTVQNLSSMRTFGTLPYRVTNVGTPTKASLTDVSLLALGSSATSFYHVYGMIPIITVTNNAFANTSSAERGLRFQIPFPARICGIRHFLNGAVGDFNAIMRNDAGAELSSSSTAFDGDITSALLTGSHDLFFDNPVSLAAGTTYRATIQPTSATNVNITTFVLPSAAYRLGTPWGSNAHYTTYVASSWTDTATETLPAMALLFDQLDNGAGGGGAGIAALVGRGLAA